MGRTRRGPFSRRVSHASRRVHTPPIPVPKATPVRSGSTSSADSASGPENPASSHASRAAMRASWPEGSRRFASTLVRRPDSRAGTASWPAMYTGRSYSLTQGWSRVDTPDTPLVAFSQVVGTSPPMGVVAPRPVTSTFRDIFTLSSCISVGERNKRMGAVRVRPAPIACSFCFRRRSR